MQTQRTRATAGRTPGYTDIGFVADVSWAISDILCRPRILRSCADESEGTGRRHRGFALFPVLRHDAGRHRKGAGCQPRTLSAGISGRRAGSGDAGAGEEETRNDSVVGGVAVSTIQTGITEQVIAWLFDHLPTVYAEARRSAFPR